MFNNIDRTTSRFGDEDPEDEDLHTIENFVEACMEDGENTYSHHQLAVLAWNTKRHRRDIRADLEGYGITLRERGQARRFRTIGDNPHDRWYGPGSCKTHGGSGWEQVTGFAGPPG